MYRLTNKTTAMETTGIVSTPCLYRGRFQGDSRYIHYALCSRTGLIKVFKIYIRFGEGLTL